MGTLKNILKAGIIAGVFVASVDATAAGNYPYDPFGCRLKIRTEMGIAPWTGNRYPDFWPRVGRCIAAHGNGVTATHLAASRAGGEARSVREPVVEHKRKTREVEPRQVEAHVSESRPTETRLSEARRRIELARQAESEHQTEALTERKQENFDRPQDRPLPAPQISETPHVSESKSASVQTLLVPAQTTQAQSPPIQTAGVQPTVSIASTASSAAASAGVQTAPAPIRLSALPSQQSAVQPSRRVALVIGNGKYDHVATLPHATNDAEALAQALETTGFQSVTLRENLTRDQTLSALADFARVADTADWAAVYYSGHGIEFRGANYMVPVDARLRVDRDVDLETVDVGKVLSAIEGARKLKLVILDACRDNPFLDQMKRTVATRAITRGLARAEPETGVLIVYAAKHGEVALDGSSRNSPFAAALLNRLQTPNLEIRRLFDLVRDDVLTTTNRRQQPFSYGSLSGSEEFFFQTN
jgi:hypothetical protein